MLASHLQECQLSPCSSMLSLLLSQDHRLAFFAERRPLVPIARRLYLHLSTLDKIANALESLYTYYQQYHLREQSL